MRRFKHWFKRYEIKPLLEIEARLILGLIFERKKKDSKNTVLLFAILFPHSFQKEDTQVCLKSHSENCLDKMQDGKIRVKVLFLTQFLPH